MKNIMYDKIYVIEYQGVSKIQQHTYLFVRGKFTSLSNTGQQITLWNSQCPWYRTMITPGSVAYPLVKFIGRRNFTV